MKNQTELAFNSLRRKFVKLDKKTIKCFFQNFVGKIFFVIFPEGLQLGGLQFRDFGYTIRKNPHLSEKIENITKKQNRKK